jgi:hypothetical protein
LLVLKRETSAPRVEELRRRDRDRLPAPRPRPNPIAAMVSGDSDGRMTIAATGELTLDATDGAVGRRGSLP